MSPEIPQDRIELLRRLVADPRVRAAAARLSRTQTRPEPTTRAGNLASMAGKGLAAIPTPPTMAVGAALQLAPEAERAVKSLGILLAHQLGLTGDENHEGWVPLLGLLYYGLWPPIKTLAHIELQVAGVLDQLFKFLGGVGAAEARGIKTLSSDLQTAWNDVIKVESTITSYF